MENTPKYRPNLVTVMIIVGLLLLRVFTGIPFWFMLAVVIFFTAVRVIKTGGNIKAESRTLAFMMAVIFFGFLGDSFWKASFPRSHAKIVITKAIWDQDFADVMGDKTNTQAKDLFEIQKDRASKEFLKYYNELLADGDVQEAMDTLKGFNKTWNTDVLDEARKKEKSSSSSSSSATPSPSPTPVPVVTPPVQNCPPLSSSLVVLKPRPEPYNITVARGSMSGQSYRIPGNCTYDVAGPGALKFKVLYSDGDVADFTTGTSHGLPKKSLATFSLQNCDACDMTISVLVTEHQAICQK